MLTMQVMACMGIIIGLFLLLGINLTDFTGNIFKRLLDGPKGIREEILEQTQRKKKSFLRREVEEIQSILKATDRENTFPFLCTVSLVLFAVGAAGAAMLGNFFLVPVAAVMTIITRFTIVSGKDMPQAMSRMGNRFLPRWIMGIFTAECVFYSDWKRTGRDMFESITEERWSTV